MFSDYEPDKLPTTKFYHTIKKLNIFLSFIFLILIKHNIFSKLNYLF